jgi:hypothetical protein
VCSDVHEAAGLLVRCQQRLDFLSKRVVTSGRPFKSSEAANNSPQAAGICSVHNVAGTYGYSGSGFVVVENPFGTPPTPIGEVGTFALNDDGTFTITKFFQNINGIIPPSSPVTGTYTVLPDCTINATNQFGDTFFGVFVDDRKEIRYMRISAVGVPPPKSVRGVVTYIAKRM